MFRAYFNFQNVHNNRGVTNVAIYNGLDEFTQYLKNLIFTDEGAEESRRIVDLFLECLPRLEDNLSIRLNQQYLTLYRADYIERSPDILEFGTRPSSPGRDLEILLAEVSKGIDWNNAERISTARIAMLKLFEEYDESNSKYPT